MGRQRAQPLTPKSSTLNLEPLQWRKHMEEDGPPESTEYDSSGSVTREGQGGFADLKKAMDKMPGEPLMPGESLL